MVLPPQQLASLVKTVAVLLACGLMLYMLSPPLYWRLARGAAHSGFSQDCATCLCNCAVEAESMLLPGYGTSLSSECARLQENGDTRSVELLAEELKLQETTAEDNQRRANAALLEAKKVASQYQKEADKCSSGMETCEEARERSDAAFFAQKKISVMWEKRARELGWRDKRQSLFDRIGLSGGVGSDKHGNSLLFRRKGR